MSGIGSFSAISIWDTCMQHSISFTFINVFKVFTFSRQCVDFMLSKEEKSREEFKLIGELNGSGIKKFSNWSAVLVSYFWSMLCLSCTSSLDFIGLFEEARNALANFFTKISGVFCQINEFHPYLHTISPLNEA